MTKFLPALFLAVVSTTTAWSQANVTYSFHDDKDGENERVTDDEKVGDGKKKIDTYTFSLKVENLSNEEVKDLQVIVYVIGAPNDWKNGTPYQIVQTLSKQQLSTPPQNSKVFEIGKVEFVTTYTKTVDYRWRGGMKYEGFAVEVYSGKDLVFEDTKGGSEAKKLVKAFKENPSKAKK